MSNVVYLVSVQRVETPDCGDDGFDRVYENAEGVVRGLTNFGTAHTRITNSDVLYAERICGEIVSGGPSESFTQFADLIVGKLVGKFERKQGGAA